MDSMAPDSTGTTSAKEAEAGYPVGWEADVVLRDGRTARLRPIRPQDAADLTRFHGQLSDQTIYFRFFAPHPRLSDAELRRFTGVDHHDRVALIVIMRGHIVGVGRYDRIEHDQAEVAFVIRDDHQGLGIGSLLLEHLAAAARENGIGRFVADVLPGNARMLATFRYAGFEVAQGYDDGVVSLSLDIEPTGVSEAVRDAREQRSEARSLLPLLRPASVAVVGASRRAGTVGHVLLRNLITSGYTGRIYAVHPSAHQILGVTCFPSLAEIKDRIGEGVDLVVIAVVAEEVPVVIDAAAGVGAGGIIVISSGFDFGGLEPSLTPARLARSARDGGMRLLGPAALGVVNTDDDVSLNASLLPGMPRGGTIGFFCQSGALAVDIMRRMDVRGLGVSDFVSAGHRADISGNDLLQLWEEDDRTHSIMLYLETVGNPRKFARLIERTARHKPVVILRTTGARRRQPALPSAQNDEVPAHAFDQIIADTGVIEVTTLDQLLDVAEVLQVRGNIGRGRIGLVGNSEAVEILARNAAEQVGLECSSPSRVLARGSSPHRFRRYLDETVRDPHVDIVVALYVPPVESADHDTQARSLIAELAATVSKPIIAVVLGWNASALRQTVRDRAGSILPIFTDVESAIAALHKVVRYTISIADSDLPSLGSAAVSGCDTAAARQVVTELTENATELERDSGWINVSAEDCDALLLHYQLPSRHALPTMPTTGAVRVVALRDRLLGPVISFGLASPIAEALGDRHYALAPLTGPQALRLVRRSVSATRDFAGVEADHVVLAEIVRRLAALLHDLPRIHRIDATFEVLGQAQAWGCRGIDITIPAAGGDRLWGARSLGRLRRGTDS